MPLQTHLVDHVPDHVRVPTDGVALKLCISRLPDAIVTARVEKAETMRKIDIRTQKPELPPWPARQRDVHAGPGCNKLRRHPPLSPGSNEELTLDLERCRTCLRRRPRMLAMVLQQRRIGRQQSVSEQLHS